MYSQSEEEHVILEFFGNKKGTVLEIGAYHPEVFSNSRALILKGWDAVLVEPSDDCYKNLIDFYRNEPQVTVVHAAIADYDGILKFYDSTGAVATASREHYDKWKNYQKDYKETYVQCVSWDSFYSKYYKSYDFISIDTEGMDYEILKQIDLEETKTELLCIEYTYNAKEINDYVYKYGFRKLLYQNGENVILAKGVW